MHNIIKTVINAGNFELTDMLKKIDKIWIEGKIDDTVRQNLIEMAQGKANPLVSIDIIDKLKDLDARVTAIELKLAAQTQPEGETPEVNEYPEYIAGHWYYAGDKITFEGVRYVCIAPEGAVCTWSPTEYPAYWTAA